MLSEIQYALEHDNTIDITTIGRKSGKTRRIEIWFHNVDGNLFITGLPGKRNWYANLLSQPAFTFHLKQSVQADIPATAIPITADIERRAVLGYIVKNINREDDLEKWVESSPLVHIMLHLDKVKISHPAS